MRAFSIIMAIEMAAASITAAISHATQLLGYGMPASCVTVKSKQSGRVLGESSPVGD